MKQWILILMMLVMAGCGSNESAQTFQGVQVKKDLVAQGMQLLGDSKVPEALRKFDEAIKQDPTNEQNYMVLGQVYLRLNNVDRAIDTLSAGLRVAPNNGELHYLLATSKALNGNREEAVKHAQRSVDIFLQQRDEERFKRSLALLKGIVDNASEGASSTAAAGQPKMMDAMNP